MSGSRGGLRRGSALHARGCPERAAVLSRALLDKRPFVWLVPDAVQRAPWLPAFFATTVTHVDPTEEGGELTVEGDVVAGWASWSPPGGGTHTLRSQLGAAAGTIRAVGLRDCAISAGVAQRSSVPSRLRGQRHRTVISWD